jgi:dipeptidyl aminopeptidase/acylaminoacyl peptidase
MIGMLKLRIVRGICVGLCLTVVLLGGSSVLAAEESSPLSAEDVAALRSVGEVAMSPDGKLAAYTLRVPRKVGEDTDGPSWSELHVVGRDRPSRGYVTGEVRVERIAWTSDGSEITFLGRRGDEKKRRLFSIAIDGGEARELLDHAAGILEYAWSPGRNRLALLAKPEKDEASKELEEKGFKQQVFEEQWTSVQLWFSTVDGVQISEPEQVPLDGSASDISFSPDGTRVIVALAPTSLVDDGYMKRRLYVLDVESREIVASIETGGKLGRIAWSPDGVHLALIAGADAHDPVAARLMVVKASGGVPDQPFEGQATDVIDIGWLDAETIVCIRASGVDRRIEKLALGSQPEVIIEGGGPIWSRLSLARGSGILAAIGDAPSHPAEVFFATTDGLAPSRATDSNAWLADRRLATQEVVTFFARDGLELQGLLLQPLNRSSDETG